MKAWYKTFSKVLSAEECLIIANNANKMQKLEATTGFGGNSCGVHPEIRKSNLVWLPRDEVNLDWLYKKIQLCVQKANADLFGFDICDFESIQFTEYKPGQFYDWHQDNCFIQSEKSTVMDRKLTVCIQLSHPSGYDGGKFWINPSQAQQVPTFSDMGDAIVFPSFLWHKVDPVTSGVRHSLVTWVNGPRFR